MLIRPGDALKYFKLPSDGNNGLAGVRRIVLEAGYAWRILFQC